jgi:tetratricopeptide (TPR) repeat protein
MTLSRTIRKYCLLSLTASLVAATLALVSVSIGPLSDAVWAKDKATVDPSKEALKLGEASMYKRDYEPAIDQFKQSIYFSRNQYNPPAWKYLGMAYKAQREYMKAIDAFNKHLAQMTEPSVAARCDLASCYVELGEFEKARKELTNAHVESSGQTDALVDCAHAKLSEKMDDLGAALSFYTQAITKDANFTEALMGRARMEVRLGVQQYPNGQYLNQALKHYMEIVDNRHRIWGANFEEIYYNMAQVFYKKGDHQGAIDHLHYALREAPDSFSCHLALAKVFDDEKHVSSAIKQYELAIPNAPRGTNLDKIKSRVMYLQQQIKPDQAPQQIKPSPLMRQQLGEQQGGLSKRYDKEPPPAPGESGF